MTETIDISAFPIRALPIKSRFATSLAGNGIRTLGDLISLNECELLKKEGIGITGVNAITKGMRELGLSFGMSLLVEEPLPTGEKMICIKEEYEHLKKRHALLLSEFIELLEEHSHEPIQTP